MIVKITTPPPCPECGEIAGHKMTCKSKIAKALSEKDTAFISGLMEAARIAREHKVPCFNRKNSLRNAIASAIEARARPALEQMLLKRRRKQLRTCLASSIRTLVGRLPLNCALSSMRLHLICHIRQQCDRIKHPAVSYRSSAS